MSQINQTHPGDIITDKDAKSKTGHSRFQLSHKMASTSRFGEQRVRLAMDVVPDDHVDLRSRTGISTFTLAKPFRGIVKHHKDTFFVPLKALLPRTYDIVVPIQTSGDDIVESYDKQCLPVVPAYRFFHVLLDCDTVPAGTFNDTDVYSVIQTLCASTWFWSPESLSSDVRNGMYFGTLRKGFVNLVADDSSDKWQQDWAKVRTATQMLDLLFSKMPNGIRLRFTQQVNGQDLTYLVEPTTSLKFEDVDTYETKVAKVPWRDIPELIRLFGGSFVVDASNSNVDAAEWTTMRQYIYAFRNVVSGQFPVGNNTSVLTQPALNYGKQFAYQLACAQFYTNDSVDDIFSANLFREAVYSMYHNIWSSNTFSQIEKFVYNGRNVEYDACAGALLYASVNKYQGTYSYALLPLISAIFGKSNSLKYRDYFTGARPRPIAVASDALSTSISVNSNLVSVIDVTKAIQVQRLLNFANTVGRRVGEYIGKLFHTKTTKSDTDPLFLSAVTQDIHDIEVDNTGEAQVTEAQSITSVMRSSEEHYQFNFDVRDYGYILMITYFDAHRLYMGITDKMNYNKSKFDLFNPFMQYQGDQAIERRELYSDNATGAFGYVTRDMQYKTIPDYANGAFDGALELFNFVERPGISELSTYAVNPVNIRNLSFEFNKYYLALTGQSPASYFHFIEEIENELHADRPMVATPQILG